jgi:hypothetical protein
MLAASFAARAEDVVFPELKDANLVQDNWYSAYAEGKKIAYTNTTVSEVKFNDKDCLLIEITDIGEMTVGDKALKREQVQRSLVIRDTYAPLYYYSSQKTEALTLVEIGRFEQKGNGWEVTVTTTLNDKTATETYKVDAIPSLYLEDSLPYLYGKAMLKDKQDGKLAFFDFEKKAADHKQYAYKGEKTEGEGDKARVFQLVADGITTMWYGPEGTVERVITMDGLSAEILSDEKTAKDPEAKWDGYKAPDYIQGDTMTIKAAGIKIQRPAPQYSFLAMFDKNVFAIADYFGGVGVVGLFLDGVPKGTEYSDGLEKLKTLGTIATECKFGDGKVIDIGKNKCFSGTLTGGAGLEAGSGKYYLFIEGSRALFFTAAGKGDTFAAAEKDITHCLESIEFFEPMYDESKLTFTDKAANLKYRVPNPGWVAGPPNPKAGISSLVAHIWTRAGFYVQFIPAQPGVTTDAILAKLSENKKVANKGEMKIGKYDAKFVDIEAPVNGVDMIMRHVMIQREDGILLLGAVATKESWEKILPDIESILKSVEFTEPEQPQE